MPLQCLTMCTHDALHTPPSLALALYEVHQQDHRERLATATNLHASVTNRIARSTWCSFTIAKEQKTTDDRTKRYQAVSFCCFFPGMGLARISLLLGKTKLNQTRAVLFQTLPEITKFDTVSSEKKLNQLLKPLYMANETRKDSLPCTGLNSAGQTFIDALYSRLEPNNH